MFVEFREKVENLEETHINRGKSTITITVLFNVQIISPYNAYITYHTI